MPPRRHAYLICPECGEQIESLNYACHTTGREWGRAYIGNDGISDHNCTDSETSETDDYEYECPECGNIISYQYIEANIQERIREDPPQEQQIKAIEPIDAGSDVINDPEHHENRGWYSRATTIAESAYEATPAIECPKCGNEFMTGITTETIETETVECTNPDCTHEFTVQEAIEKYNIIK